MTLTHMRDGRESEAFIQRINIDHFYFELYEIGIIAGIGFQKNVQYDVEEVVLNRKASDDLGFDKPADALGEMRRMGENVWKVVGSVENYHHHSFKD